MFKELATTTWGQAPQLKLKVRLNESTREGSSSTVTLLGKQDERCRVQGRHDGNGKVEVELPPDIPLTTLEKCD